MMLTDLRNIGDARKTAILNHDLKRLNVDIATHQETRLHEAGTLKQKDYTFYWQEKSSDGLREHGVGYAVKNTFMKKVEPGSNGSALFFTLRLITTEGNLTLVKQRRSSMRTL